MWSGKLIPFLLAKMKGSTVGLVLLLLASGALSDGGCYYFPTSSACDYDFSSLSLSGPPFYEYDAFNSDRYQLNICAPVTGTPCSDVAGVCQTTAHAGSFNLGMYSNHFVDIRYIHPGNCPGARLIYKNGTQCASGQARETAIDLVCDSSATYPRIANVTEDSPCHYSIIMYTKAACGAQRPSASASSSPGLQPSSSPSPFPSAFPSAYPSASPSAYPSVHPSAYPSAHPSAYPSAFPSMSPSAEPSFVYTSPLPSANPSSTGWWSSSVTKWTSLSATTTPWSSSSSSPWNPVSSSPSATATVSVSSPPACHAFPIQGLRPGFDLTLFGSTTNAPVFSDACQNSGRTVWYTIKPTPYANITLSTCNSYTNFDTVMALRTGRCTELQCFMSNDDACQSLGSTITFTSAPDVQYFLSITGNNGATGNFELIVSTTGAADPTCTDAVFLPAPYFTPLRIAGGNQGSMASSMSSCGVASGDKSVWYHLSPVVGSPVIVSTCSANTNFDTVVSIFQGSCSTSRCVAQNDNNCTTPNGNGAASTVVFTPTATSYYAVVSGRGGSTGYYQLYVRQEKVLGYNCEGSYDLALSTSSVVVTGSTVSTGNFTTPICGRETGNAYWYHVAVTHDSQITIDTCSSGTNFDTYLDVYSGSCANLVCLSYNDDGCSSGNRSRLTINRAAGEDFYVAVSGYLGAVGQFELQFTLQLL